MLKLGAGVEQCDVCWQFGAAEWSLPAGGQVKGEKPGNLMLFGVIVLDFLFLEGAFVARWHR